MGVQMRQMVRMWCRGRRQVHRIRCMKVCKKSIVVVVMPIHHCCSGSLGAHEFRSSVRVNQDGSLWVENGGSCRAVSSWW